MNYTNTLSFSKLPAGYPFANGQWVAPQLAPAPRIPFAPNSGSDNVCLTEQALNNRNENAGSGCITVKSGDCLSQLLLERGYSLKEMFQKDENGLSLIDRTAAANNLRNPNLIHVGQELNLPSKEAPPEPTCAAEPVSAAEPAPASPEASPEGVVLFDDFRDGVIDEHDLEISDHTHKAFAGNGDLNDDGRVDWSEHLRANSLRYRVEDWDTNRNGQLDSDELNAVGARVWNENGDGEVSDDELTAVGPTVTLTATTGRIEADPEFR